MIWCLSLVCSFADHNLDKHLDHHLNFHHDHEYHNRLLWHALGFSVQDLCFSVPARLDPALELRRYLQVFEAPRLDCTAWSSGDPTPEDRPCQVWCHCFNSSLSVTSWHEG